MEKRPGEAVLVFVEMVKEKNRGLPGICQFIYRFMQLFCEYLRVVVGLLFLVEGKKQKFGDLIFTKVCKFKEIEVHKA